MEKEKETLVAEMRQRELATKTWLRSVVVEEMATIQGP